MNAKNYALPIIAVMIGLSILFAWMLIGAQASPVIQTGETEPLNPAKQTVGSPRIRSRFTGGDFLISHLDNSMRLPDIAYNSTDDEYLVVWSDFRDNTNEGSNIMGQVYSALGVPQGMMFNISRANDSQTSPRVMYNPTRSEYLVAWVDFRLGAEIYGQRVSAAGLLLNNPSTPANESDPAVNFPISTAAGWHYPPDLAYNPTADEYLVVWTDDRIQAMTSLNVYGQRVDGDGALLGNADPAVNFLISPGGGYGTDPKLAYNNNLDEYIVVWRDSSVNQVNGQRVDANGSLIESYFQITSDDQAIEYKPSLAYNPIRHRYLVTGQNHHQQLFGQWMNGDGTLDGNAITLSDQVNGEYSASTCVDTVSGQTLVTWGDDRNSEDSDIYAARILPNGELAPQGDFAISIVDEDQKNPAVGCSSALHQFLVVYDDGRDTSRQRIFAQRVSWWGMLLGAEFAVGVPNLAAFDPSIAFDEREIRYLVVWSDDRNGDSDIFGQLFDRDGLPIEDNFTIYQGAGEQTRPDIAYNAASSSYLVAWEDQPNRSVVGQLVSAQGSLQYSPLTISSSVYTSTNPAVASNPEAAYNNFLVVFRQDVDRTSQNDVEARIVNPDGTLAASSTHVSSLIGEQGLPDVIYNPTSHEYLVAFQDKSSGVYQITGQILSPVNQLVGGKIPISTGATMYEQAPAVVYNPDDNQYLVVWHRDNVATGEDIYGQLLAAGGSFPIGETNFKISTVTGDNQQMFPAAIYFAAMNRYAVIWGDNRDPTTQWDLRGQWLSNTGDVLGPFDLPIFRDLGVQSNPAIVYAPGYDQALTVWYENTLPGIFGIHGRFGALDTTPPKARFTIDPGAGFSGETFAFNAWPSRDDLTPPGMLLVRWDLNNDGAWDTSLGHDKYITMTVFAQGIHTVTLEVWNLAWMTDTLKRRFDVIPPPLKPDANPDQPTTPSANLTITPTLGTAGSLFKFDGRESSGFWLLGVRWDFENDGRFETGLSNVLTSTHVYTQAGDYTARLELWDLDQTGRSAIANLTVLPATFTSLEASPSELRVIPKEAVLLRSVAGDVYGNGVFNPAGSTWSMLNPAAGSVDASGKFTASQQAGTYPDAIQVSLGGLTDRITVTIYWPYQVRLPLVRK